MFGGERRGCGLYPKSYAADTHNMCFSSTSQFRASRLRNCVRSVMGQTHSGEGGENLQPAGRAEVDSEHLLLTLKVEFAAPTLTSTEL